MAVRCETRAACCIEWVTMTIVKLVAQLVDQFLDLGGRDRIERRAGLVHQDDFRADGNGARDAQTLLLAARKTGARLLQAILHLVPQDQRFCRLVSTICVELRLRLRASPWMRGP